MLQVNLSSSDLCHSSPHLNLSQGAHDMLSGVPANVLNMSPRPSYNLNSLERTSGNQSTFCWEAEKAPGFSSIASNSSNVTPTRKSSAELMKEIGTLEVEIMHLERYLLSLYRTAFEQRLPALHENFGSCLQYDTGSPLQIVADQSCHESEPYMWKVGIASHPQTSPPCGLAKSDNLSHAALQKVSSARDHDNTDPLHRSLADLLGASCIDKTSNTPDRLSEDIVKCISSIYCKLANPRTHAGLSVSSTSSFSSSSTFSPRNFSDSWSPHCNEEVIGHEKLQEFKGKSRPCAAMIEVLKIRLDDDSFNYAARMLQKFRSLVKSLEKVDPLKMKREEKLAFWINIHNALVMHSYLAYGTQTHVRSSSLLKAAYNVGGHCVNANIVQSSILGIRSHYSLPWLQTLLTPGKKLKKGSVRHVYAIEYPEPLVHFALCSGAYSDPVLRIYKAKNVFQDLKLAREEFLRANVDIHKTQTKIHLPKILYYFAKDMSMDMPGLLEVVKECVSQVQRKAIIKCLKVGPDKCIHWMSQSSMFRYIILGELAEQDQIILE